MGFSFRKTFKLGKGVSFGLSKKGIGLSLGLKGLKLGLGSGRKARIRAGRGPFHYYGTLGGKQGRKKSKADADTEGCMGCLLVFSILFLAGGVLVLVEKVGKWWDTNGDAFLSAVVKWGIIFLVLLGVIGFLILLSRFMVYRKRTKIFMEDKEVGIDTVELDLPCPHCRVELSYENTLAGQALACPRCGGSIEIPSFPTREN